MLTALLGVVFFTCPAWAGSISVPHDRGEKAAKKINIIYLCSEFDDIGARDIRGFLKTNFPKISMPNIYVNSNKYRIIKPDNKFDHENIFIYFGSAKLEESLRECVEGFPEIGISYDVKTAEVGAVVGVKPPVFEEIPLGEQFAPLISYSSRFRNKNNEVFIYMTSVKSLHRNGYMLMSVFSIDSSDCCKVNGDGTVARRNQ